MGALRPSLFRTTRGWLLCGSLGVRADDPAVPAWRRVPPVAAPRFGAPDACAVFGAPLPRVFGVFRCGVAPRGWVVARGCVVARALFESRDWVPVLGCWLPAFGVAEGAGREAAEPALEFPAGLRALLLGCGERADPCADFCGVRAFGVLGFLRESCRAFCDPLLAAL